MIGKSKEYFQLLMKILNEEWISDKTRYACDGLLHQRLDAPFIKYNGKFEKASWDEVYKIIKSKFEKHIKRKNLWLCWRFNQYGNQLYF